MNNLIQGKGSPAERLEWLLQWAQARWPGTRFGVVALTPNNWDNAHLVGPTNKQFSALAKRQGAAFTECCQVGADDTAAATAAGGEEAPRAGLLLAA